MKKYYIIFSLLFAVNILSAQCSGMKRSNFISSTEFEKARKTPPRSFNSDESFNSIVRGYSVKTISETYAMVDGSPYLTDNLVKGYLVLNNDEIIENVLLQVDAYKEELIVLNASGEKIYLDSRYYKEAGFQNDEEEVILRKVNPKKPNRFYEVLFNGSTDGLVFFKETYVILREGHNNGRYKREPSFTQGVHYYIKQEGEIAKVKLKKKEVFRQFPEFEHIAMNEYIKKHGIKLKGEKDFTNMFAGLYE